MFVLIPLICLIFATMIIYQSKKRLALCLREAYLSAYVLWGAVFVLSTEILNIFQGVTFLSISFGWFILLFLLIIVYLKVEKKADLLLLPDFKAFNFFDYCMVFFLVMSFVLIGMVAFFASPNNWDSLTCHMARVAHWIQNKSVDPYPTSMFKQIYYPPGAAYLVLHLKILAKSDVAVNFVQFFGMCASVVSVSLISKEFGLKRRGQLMASLFAITVPMGILQATSTQNDQFVGGWILCFFYFILRLKQFDYTGYAVLSGLSLGMAYLIKGTGYLYTLPMLVWLILSKLHKRKCILLRHLFTIFSCTILLIFSFYFRNYQVQGHILGAPDIHTELKTYDLTPKLYASIIIRNIGLHLGTSIDELNEWTKQKIYDVHRWMDVDIKDDRTTFATSEFIIPVTLHEDHAGNFTHLLIIVIALILLPTLKLGEKKKDVMIYLFALFTSFLLFCWLTKWTAASSRYHLPLFILFAPFVAVVVSHFKYKKIAMTVLILFVVSTAVPYVFRNATRRLISSKKATVFNTSREQQYFQNDQSYYKPYKDVAQYLKKHNIKNIGMIIPSNWWEYPFWVLIKGKNESDIRLEHVQEKGSNTHYVSGKYPLGKFLPEAIIVLHGGKSQLLQIKENDQKYFLDLYTEKIQIYKLIPDINTN